MTSPAAPEPYGSARDLPSFRELERQLAGLKALNTLLRRGKRDEIRRLEQQLRQMTDTVDGFYALLGERNWIFTGDLNMPAMAQVIAVTDPGEAESRFVAYYQDENRIQFPLGRLHRFAAMRPRMPLLEKALRDHQEQRYYSTVLALLTVMDGFVNDLDKSDRQGLHARQAEDMVAWDSVVGHHLGLSHAHKSFTKSFYKTDETEVTELYRNGILHGTLVNFDNIIVATKAWNRLFAVADWADARAKQAGPAQPRPSLRETLRDWGTTQQRQRRLDTWTPHDCSPSDPDCELVGVVQDFLTRWQARQWGPLGQFFMPVGAKRESVGKLAQLAKDLYEDEDLTGWVMQDIHHTAAAVAMVEVALDVNGTTHQTQLRWVHVRGDGHIAPEWSTGTWTLSLYGPVNFLTARREGNS